MIVFLQTSNQPEYSFELMFWILVLAKSIGRTIVVVSKPEQQLDRIESK